MLTIVKLNYKKINKYQIIYTNYTCNTKLRIKLFKKITYKLLIYSNLKKIKSFLYSFCIVDIKS